MYPFGTHFCLQPQPVMVRASILHALRWSIRFPERALLHFPHSRRSRAYDSTSAQHRIGEHNGCGTEEVFPLSFLLLLEVGVCEKLGGGNFAPGLKTMHGKGNPRLPPCALDRVDRGFLFRKRLFTTIDFPGAPIVAVGREIGRATPSR